MIGRSRTDQWEGRYWPLAVIWTLGVVLRLVHFWFVAQTPWSQHHLMMEYDDFMNFQWVQTILAGDWLGRATYHPYTEYMQHMAPLETWYQWWGGKEIFHQAPLYPYFLAVLLGACRGSVSCVFLVQLLLGSLQPLLLYALAARLFDRRAGLIAAALAAIYGPFIFHEATLLRDWLLPMVEALAILLLLKARVLGKPSSWVLAGAALGLAVLTRESALVLMVLALGWVLIEAGGTRLDRSRAAAYVIGGILLSLSPLIIRNEIVGAPAFAISNRFAEAMVASNTGGPVQASFAPIMEASRGQPVSIVVAIFDTFAGAYERLLNLWLWKFEALKDPFEIPNNVSFYYGRDVSPVLRWSLGYAVVFPLGLAGLFMSLSSWRQQSLLLVYSFAGFIWLMVISPLSRYRLSLVPVLLVFAAGSIIQAIDAARQRNSRRVMAICSLVLVMVVFQRWVLPFPETGKHSEWYLMDYWASARVYAAEKRFEEAAAEMGRMLSLAQEGRLRTGLIEQSEADYVSYRAAALIAQGKQEEARAILDQGTTALLKAHQARGFGATYPLFNFATLYIRLDAPDRAMPLLKRFLELAPTDASAGRAKRLLTRIEESDVQGEHSLSEGTPLEQGNHP